jgi:hypothetical protein
VRSEYSADHQDLLNIRFLILIYYKYIVPTVRLSQSFSSKSELGLNRNSGHGSSGTPETIIHHLHSDNRSLGQKILGDYLPMNISIRIRDGCSSHEYLDRRCSGALVAATSFDFDADSLGRPADKSSISVIRTLREPSLLEEPPSYVLVGTEIGCLLKDAIVLIDSLVDSNNDMYSLLPVCVIDAVEDDIYLPKILQSILIPH